MTTREYYLDRAEAELERSGDDYNEADVSSLADAMMIEECNSVEDFI